MKKQKLLIVDDQLINLKVTSAMLKNIDAELFTASSGEESIRFLENQPDIDLILMDVQMPGLTGFETVKLIKQNSLLTEIPIIFVTAFMETEEFVREGFSLGAIDYLIKPFLSEILNNKVKIFLSLQEQKKLLQNQAFELSKINRNLNIINECSKTLLLAETENEVLNAFCSILVDLADFKLAIVIRHDEVHSFNVLLNYDKSDTRYQNTDDFTEFLKQAILKEEINLHEISELKYPDYPNRLDDFSNQQVHSYLISVPIKINGKLEYNFIIQTNNTESIESDETELLQNISQTLAIGLSLIREKQHRILLQNALVNEKEELRLTLSSISDGVVAASKNGSILYVNNAAGFILDSSPEELKTRNVFNLFSIFDDEKFLLFNPFDYLQSVSLDIGFSKQFTIETHSGNKKIIMIQISAILKDAVLDSIVIVLRDLTEQTRTANQLLLAQKMESVGQLAAGIAHEINTPMQFVGDNTYFLKDAFSEITNYLINIEKIQANSENNDIIKNLREESDIDYLMNEIPVALERTAEGIKRVSNIVKAMKDFAHPSGQQKSNTKINDSILTTVTITKNEWKYSADLEMEFDESIPTVLCTVDEVNQVILNMIINAVHAIQEAKKTRDFDKGLIKIKTYYDEEFVYIAISDSGTGISKENLNRVFDPFFTTKEVGKGTGQGLAIAHDIIVNKHGGKIDLESKVGEGTKFIIALPR